MEVNDILKLVVDLTFIFLVAFPVGIACKKFLKIPKIIGYIATGVLLGPMFIDFFKEATDGSLGFMNPLVVSVVRDIALAIVVFRAGLAISFKRLKKIGPMAGLLGTVPALLEASIVFIIAKFVGGWDTNSALAVSFVIAAVSPAVIIPALLKLKYTTQSHKVIDTSLLSTSLDDVFALTMFAIIIGITTGGSSFSERIWMIPTSLIISVVAGAGLGWLLSKALAKLDHIIKSIIYMAISVAVVILHLPLTIPLIFVLALGLSISAFTAEREDISGYRKIWHYSWKVVVIPLFALVGISLEFSLVPQVLLLAIAIVFAGITFRMFATLLCVSKSDFTDNEKAFLLITTIPKATVQAAIGATPLAFGFLYGAEILAISTLSILFTAPLGAILIDKFGTKLLNRQEGIK